MAESPFNEPRSPRLSRCDAAGSRVRVGRRLRGLQWGIASQEGLRALKHPRPTGKASASQKSLLVSSFRLDQRAAGAVGRIVYFQAGRSSAGIGFHLPGPEGLCATATVRPYRSHRQCWRACFLARGQQPWLPPESARMVRAGAGG